MKKILISIIIISYSCSPCLQNKRQELYTFTNSECTYSLELNLDLNYLYYYNCLGIKKVSRGTWKLSNDTVYFNVTEPVKIEEFLSSQFLATMPKYGKLKKTKTIVLDKIELKSK